MPEQTPDSIPLVQEELKVGKRRVETGRVRIRTVVEERLARVGENLEHEDVIIDRVAVNREVTHAPAVREQDGVLIVPVLEEVLVVEKRLVLKEELHIRKKRKRERFEEAVRVRGMRAEIERLTPRPSRSGEPVLEPTSSAAGEAPHREQAPRRAPRLARKERVISQRKP